MDVGNAGAYLDFATPIPIERMRKIIDQTC